MFIDDWIQMYLSIEWFLPPYWRVEISQDLHGGGSSVFTPLWVMPFPEESVPTANLLYKE